jgi:hypothetical protein
LSSISAVRRIGPILPIAPYEPGEDKPKKVARQQVLLAPEGLVPRSVAVPLAVDSSEAQQVSSPRSANLPALSAKPGQKSRHKGRGQRKAERASRKPRGSNLLLGLLQNAKAKP